MENKRTPIFIIMLLFSMIGFWQFSSGIRSVDVLGLFASGALAGSALTGFLIIRSFK